MNKYVNQFLGMKCAGDVLNVVSPLGNKSEKEITEAMAMLRLIKPIVLKNPMNYILYDLCAGNALTSIIGVYRTPIGFANAVDIKPRGREYHKVKRFEYSKENLHSFHIPYGVDTAIISAIHPCKNLAIRVIDIYLESNVKYLMLMPCCGDSSSVHKYDKFIEEKLGKYVAWVYYLRDYLIKCLGIGNEDYKVRVLQDNFVESPCNLILTCEWKNPEE